MNVNEIAKTLSEGKPNLGEIYGAKVKLEQDGYRISYYVVRDHGRVYFVKSKPLRMNKVSGMYRFCGAWEGWKLEVLPKLLGYPERCAEVVERSPEVISYQNRVM